VVRAAAAAGNAVESGGQPSPGLRPPLESEEHLGAATAAASADAGEVWEAPLRAAGVGAQERSTIAARGEEAE
jgi:hypothetical protein